MAKMPFDVYARLRSEQRELAARIGRLAQFIESHDNSGTDKDLSDDYMDILRDQLDAMKDYNTCLVQRIGIAVTDGVAPRVREEVERARGNQAIRRDVRQFRESYEPDPRDPAPKQDSDRVVVNEDYCNFNCYFDPAIL